MDYSHLPPVDSESETRSCSVVSDPPWPRGFFSPGNSPGQNTGVGSLSLLQGIFPTQGSKPGLPHCRQILYQLSHQGSPRILGWVAYPFSSRSSWPRSQTGVSYTAGRFFTNWAIREALNIHKSTAKWKLTLVTHNPGDVVSLPLLYPSYYKPIHVWGNTDRHPSTLHPSIPWMQAEAALKE